MQLDFIPNINEYGDNIVRLYDFDSKQATLFRQAIIDNILNNASPLDLSTLPFIKARNCNLILRISETDEGIMTLLKGTFYCDMTLQGYENMVALMDSFCTKETKGYQFLYDVDSSTDFLFSPAGTW